MLIIKIIVLLWVITGTLLGVGFCYSDKSDGYFDGLGFLLWSKSR